MGKHIHEVRDGVHGFILFDDFEKRLIDSRPMQRLRCIHQLAMCYQVYPGAVHSRFEHSLGVMETATRIFDRLFNERPPDDVHRRIADKLDGDGKAYWRRVVRLAGLLHDVGHLPFSHAGEHLLPEGWNHERITAEMIRNSEIAEILQEQRPPIVPEDIVDVAWDATKRPDTEPDAILSPWKALLNSIVCGNTFGADRIDYLLRDSWHAGVAYGRFDPDRLISGLTTLIDPETEEVSLGLDIGAIHAAEALLLARYFMYTQVYFHDVRKAYDLHLKEFLQGWLPDGKFSPQWQKLLEYTDHEVLAAMRLALADSANPLHEQTRRLLAREHFRTAYELIATDKQRRPTILADLRSSLETEFGSEHIRSHSYGPKSESNDFLVKTDSGEAVRSLQVSGVIAKVPQIEIGFVFAARDICNKAKDWVRQQLPAIVGDGGS